MYKRQTIECPEIAALSKAGQFVHIRVPGFTLRRPISICEVDKQAGTIRILFDIRGEGTKALANTKEGDLLDVMGPLGNGFELLDPSKKAVVVGGGIGVPPMLETAKSYGENATAILGFRSEDKIVLTDDFTAQKNRVMPVSYTHLDVYKRQAPRCAGAPGGCWRYCW